MGSADFVYDFEPLYVPRLTEGSNINQDGKLDNPHTCILDDSVRCLTCALIEVLGEDRRDEALTVASIIAGSNETMPPPRVLSDIEFRVLLDWLMVSDPWPLEAGADAVMQDLAIREWGARGHEADNSWIVAYHTHPRQDAAT